MSINPSNHYGCRESEPANFVNGLPRSLASLPDGSTVATYEYTVGNEPSTGRAVGHAAMDVLTLGIWEVVGTPVEALNQGEKVAVTVQYDQNQVATSMQSSKMR